MMKSLEKRRILWTFLMLKTLALCWLKRDNVKRTKFHTDNIDILCVNHIEVTKNISEKMLSLGNAHDSAVSHEYGAFF